MESLLYRKHVAVQEKIYYQTFDRKFDWILLLSSLQRFEEKSRNYFPDGLISAKRHCLCWHVSQMSRIARLICFPKFIELLNFAW